MRRIVLLLILISVAGTLCLLNGCGPKTESTNVETSGIYAKFLVHHFADNTVKAYAQLLVGGEWGTKLDLTSEEHLLCNGQEMIKGMNNWYYANFPSPCASGEYLFRFTRKNNETVDTTLIMAAEPVIINVNPNPLQQGVDALTVNWDSFEPGSMVRILVEGNTSGVIYPIDRYVTDNGSYVINSDRFVKYEGASPGTYGATVTTTRITYQPDAVNPAYQGGHNEVRRYASKYALNIQIP
ncbi:MAG: hypothetical protein K6U80_01485 [Firmicutes bacterium]|nr:hypothetical protein [Bacillota bacterium]